MEAYLNKLKEYTRIKEEIEYSEDILNGSIDHDCKVGCDCYNLPVKIESLKEELKNV